MLHHSLVALTNPTTASTSALFYASVAGAGMEYYFVVGAGTGASTVAESGTSRATVFAVGSRSTYATA